MKPLKLSVEKIVFYIFGGIGITFFIVFIGMMTAFATQVNNKDSYEEITATISEITRHKSTNNSKSSHRVYLDYVYHGQEYNHVRYNYYNSNMKVGDVIDVKIDKNDPYDFYDGMALIICIIVFGTISVVFLIVGGVVFGVSRKKEILEKKIRETGMQYWGVIVGVKHDLTITVNRRHPYYFAVAYEDEGIITSKMECKSKDVWITVDPAEFIGKQIKVFVNPENTQQYVVDLDSIVY